jgi:hypothetical protein
MVTYGSPDFLRGSRVSCIKRLAFSQLHRKWAQVTAFGCHIRNLAEPSPHMH